MKRISFLLLALALVGITTQSSVHNVPYVIGFHPLNSSQQPFVGQMFLNFNDGTISGKYTDISVMPGSPLANVINTAVQGSISSDGSVILMIRHLTFRGTMKGQWMSGSLTTRGRIYVFDAEQGKAPGF
ncbi:MAG TPA: hypothetical protein VFN49_00300 [Candidatus Aquilonibacter sp.]|nr:hypothetical protein [Candidatus Aquilonibacter sp.]